MGFNDLNGGTTGPSKMAGYGTIPKPMYRVLDTNGDGSGTTNANGNYNSAIEIFYIQPAAGEIFRLEQMMMCLRGEKGKLRIDWYYEDHALSVGVQFRIQDDSGTITDLSNGLPIKRLGDYMRLCGEVNLYTSSDQASTYGYAGTKWDLSAAGYPIKLDGSNNERLEVVLHDNFSTLDEHYFTVQGYYEKA